MSDDTPSITPEQAAAALVAAKNALNEALHKACIAGLRVELKIEEGLSDSPMSQKKLRMSVWKALPS
jgi:hypothetical protein